MSDDLELSIYKWSCQRHREGLSVSDVDIADHFGIPVDIAEFYVRRLNETTHHALGALVTPESLRSVFVDFARFCEERK